MKKHQSWIVLGILALGLPMTAQADPAGSSTAAGGGNTTGVDLDVTLSPGGVALRAFEADAKFSRTNDGTKSFQASARLPVHVLHDPTEERQGILLNPGFKLRIDEKQTQDGGRLLIEGTGLGIYRWQAMSVHDTPKDRQNLKESVERAKVAINHVMRANPVPAKPYERSYRYEDSAETAKLRQAYEAAEPTLAKVDDAIRAILKQEHILNEDPSYASTVRELADKIREGLASHPDGSATRMLLQAGSGGLVINSPVNSEASGAGEIVVGHAGYRYDDNRELGTRQNGALLTPIQAAGHVAFRINRLVNVGFCGAVKPLEILAGENEGVGLLSSSIEGCADITVGELPTVRNRFGTTYNYNLNGDPGGKHGDPNGAFSYANSLTLEKKLGPVTPYVGWTLEHQQADSGANITNHWFTVGVAH